MAILIADSGATSTDWLYVDGEHVSNYQTQGLYPSFINPETDLKSVKSAIGQLTPNTICFYGTGCGISEADEIVRTFLKRIFPDATIHIKSDLEGAGIAFFGKGSGIVAVLGTGSICARMEEGKLTQRSAALGYVIGDEGSAADLGRRILKVYFREAADRETIAFIANKLDHVEYGAMINRIYQSDKPNRELASVAGQVLQGSLPSVLSTLIADAFTDFMDHQLSMLNPAAGDPIVFTGTVANVHQHLLLPIMTRAGYENTSVTYPVISAFEKRVTSGTLHL